MTFSYSKLTLLRPQKEKRLFTFLVAMCTAACFFVPYMLLSEGYFVFYGDFNVQQIPFYQMCHDAIRNGNVGWNWLTDLGADFVGSYAFYLLGSPFFWITLLFPNWMVPYLMGPLLILKFGLAALSAYFYIRRFTKTSDAAALGGILYAFSGFSIYNIFFNHFHEAIIVFPLLLLGIELLLTENRRGIFALCVTASALMNYFFFFGMVLFCIIYYIVRVASSALKFKLSRFAVLVFEAVVGLLMASVLLLPAILSIADNSRISNTLIGWNGITYGKEQIYLNIIQCFFFPPDLPARPVFFPGANVKWSSLGGWLPVFSMVGVLTYFTNRKGSWLKRIIAVCSFMAMVPILNSAFYAFNASYYARWFYMPILMMCLATVMLTEGSSVDWSSGFKWTTAITLGFTLVIGFFPQKNEDGQIVYGLYTQDDDGIYAIRFWIACLIALVSLAIVKALLGLLKSDRRLFYRSAVACVCVVSVLYANVFVAMGRAHSYDIKEVVIDDLIEGRVDLGDGEWRIDTYDGIDNTGMFLGYPSINAFHSVVPASIVEFYDFFGVSRSVASRPSTKIEAIRPLLSVKYLLNRTDGDSFIGEDGETLMTGYEYVRTEGGYYIYENTNYIPYGFSYDYYMTYDFCENYSPELRAHLMLKAILLTDEQIEKYGDCITDISFVGYGQEDGVSLSFTDFAMSEDCDKLALSSAKSFVRDNGGFTAAVERDKKSLVFFSIPYDEGWSATVNGKSVEIEKVNAGLMAVEVDSGESVIRFDYKTRGLEAGVKITLGTMLVFVIYLLISSTYVKRHPSESEYPEGEQLLQLWRSEDMLEAVSRYGRHEVIDWDSDEDDEKDSSSTENNGVSVNGGFKVDADLFTDE